MRGLFNNEIAKTVDLENTNSSIFTEDNDWTREQEQLLVNWAEKSSGYHWLHTRSVNYYKKKNKYISLPASIFAYLAGGSSFLMYNVETISQYSSIFIGFCGILAGILSNIHDMMRYKEESEKHRISALAFLAFFRDISVELSLEPKYRENPITYITLKRLEMDRLMEQSPTIPDEIINDFKVQFKYVSIKKPDIINSLQTIQPYNKKKKREIRKTVIVKPFLEKAIIKDKFNKWKKYVFEKRITKVNKANARHVEIANSEDAYSLSRNDKNNNIKMDGLSLFEQVMPKFSNFLSYKNVKIPIDPLKQSNQSKQNKQKNQDYSLKTNDNDNEDGNDEEDNSIHTNDCESSTTMKSLQAVVVDIGDKDDEENEEDDEEDNEEDDDKN